MLLTGPGVGLKVSKSITIQEPEKKLDNAECLSDMQILNTAFWRGSSDRNKGFHSLWHHCCGFFQHLGNSSSQREDSFHNPLLHSLELLAHPSHMPALTATWTSHFTSLRCVLLLTGLTCPQVSVHRMSAP